MVRLAAVRREATPRPHADEGAQQHGLPQRAGEHTLAATEVHHRTLGVQHQATHVPHGCGDERVPWVHRRAVRQFAAVERVGRVQRGGLLTQRLRQVVLERLIAHHQVHRDGRCVARRPSGGSGLEDVDQRVETPLCLGAGEQAGAHVVAVDAEAFLPVRPPLRLGELVQHLLDDRTVHHTAHGLQEGALPHRVHRSPPVAVRPLVPLVRAVLVRQGLPPRQEDGVVLRVQRDRVADQ